LAHGGLLELVGVVQPVSPLPGAAGLRRINNSIIVEI